MKRIRRISLMLALAMLAGMTGVLSGCNKDDMPVEENATQITFYYREFEEWANEIMEEYVKEFNSNLEDGIQIVPKSFTEANYNDKLKVARENSSALDVYMIEYGAVATQAMNDYAAPLNPYFQPEVLDNIYDNAREMVTFNGQMYAFPWMLEPGSMFFYRKDLLADAGVSEAPTDWQQLYEACAKVKPKMSKGSYALGLPTGTALGWATVGMQVNTAGHLAVNDKWDECLIDADDGYKHVAQFFHTMAKNGYAPKESLTSNGYENIVEALCEGRLAMTFGGSWSIARIMQYYPEMADKIGVAALPTYGEGGAARATSANGGWSFCISSTSRNKEKAAQFINWLLVESSERTAKYFNAAYHSKAPTTKSMGEYLESVDSGVSPDWTAALNDVASKAVPEPGYTWDITNEVLLIFASMQSAENMEFETAWEQALASAKKNISTIMSRSDYKTNPKYDE